MVFGGLSPLLAVSVAGAVGLHPPLLLPPKQFDIFFLFLFFSPFFLFFSFLFPFLFLFSFSLFLFSSLFILLCVGFFVFCFLLF